MIFMTFLAVFDRLIVGEFGSEIVPLPIVFAAFLVSIACAASGWSAASTTLRQMQRDGPVCPHILTLLDAAFLAFGSPTTMMVLLLADMKLDDWPTIAFAFLNFTISVTRQVLSKRN